jgi:F-type H+-transporting ATPase subunit alpha
LLERAGKLSYTLGAGSLTSLPVIETQAGDVSAYIPTNVISITDGQIFLDKDLFLRNNKPAVNVGVSVSRIGSTAQLPATKSISSTLKLEIAQFRELEIFLSLDSDLDETTLFRINRGLRLVEMLIQSRFEPLTNDYQFVVIFAGLQGILDSLPVAEVQTFIHFLL